MSISLAKVEALAKSALWLWLNLQSGSLSCDLLFLFGRLPNGLQLFGNRRG
jgi:hypothetical protein